MAFYRRLLFVIFFLTGAVSFSQDLPEHENQFKFLENKGQWPANVLYAVNTPQAKMYIEQSRVLYKFIDASDVHKIHFGNEKIDDPKLEMELIAANFVGSNKINSTEQHHPSSEYYNFFRGNDKSKWTSKVYGYADVAVHNIYDSIDLRFNSQGEHLKYEFIIKKGGSPSDIQIRYDNAESIKVLKNGNLSVKGKIGVIEEKKPYVYQIKNGKIIEVECNFKLERNTITYSLGDYDKNIDLVIDPDLVFASYSGSLTDNFGMTATYDNHGNLYSAGTVFGNAYPTTAGAYDEEGNFTVMSPSASQAIRFGITDVFVSKYSADGTTLLYSTYLGGGDDEGGTEVPHSLICNEDNELYLFGTTSSSDFPLVNPYQSDFNGGLYRFFNNIAAFFYGSDGTEENGGTDFFICKFSEEGDDLLSSTYLGGTGNDGLNYNETGGNNGNLYGGLMFNYGDPFRGEIMLDDEGNCYVASSTYSEDFPLVNPIQSDYGGLMDGVVFKFNPDLSDLLWSTYIGGSSRDACYSIEFDSEFNIYVAGGTFSPNFPTTPNVIQENHNNTSSADGFITKISPDGSTILNATYIGTASYDQTYFLQLDRHDNLFVLGQTLGEIQPTEGVYANPNSGQFIMQLENDLSSIVFQTTFGNGNGRVNISPTAFLVDICGNIYVTGWGAGISGSLHQNFALNGMPISPNAYQATPPNGYDFYLIVLSENAEELIYGSYLGGDLSTEHVDGGTSRFDKNGVVYHSGCGGCGGHTDFPTYPDDVWSATNNSTNCNNLVFKFDFNLIPRARAAAEEYVVCKNTEIQLYNISENYVSFEWNFGNGETNSITNNPIVSYDEVGTYKITLVVVDAKCGLEDSTSFTIEVIPEVQMEPLVDIYQCQPTLIPLTANSFGTATDFIWSSNSDFSDTLNVSTKDSVVEIFSIQGGYFYLKATNGYCEQIDSLLIFFTSASLQLEGDTKLCIGDSTIISAMSVNDSITFQNYIWEPEEYIVSGQGEDEVTVFSLTTQYISLTADASNGCIVKDSILISVSDIDSNEVSVFASDTLIPFNSSVTLTASPSGYFYSWIPTNGVHDPDSAQTIAILGENTLFTVVITDSICFFEDTVIINVFDYVCEEPNLFVPNAFTPNDDGNNDVLYVRSRVIDDTRNFVFRVFNRWGEMVFETFDINEGWNGDWKGKRAKPDVYDYYLEGFCIDGQAFLIQGNVTLIR